MDKINEVAEWLLEPGLAKSTMFGFAGLAASWAVAEIALRILILVATATLITIHVVNAIVRQWCPLRRQKITDCSPCRFKGTIFCSRCTEKE